MLREMNADAELLDAMLNEAPITSDGPLTAKLVRHWTGYAIQTISDYRNGRLTIPVRFWRVVYQHSHDPRIPDLLLGGLGYHLQVFEGLPRLETDKALFRAAIDGLKLYHEEALALAQICCDGRIDEADAGTIGRYNHAHLELAKLLAATCCAVNRTYAASCARRAAS